jgi:hypothetical protein
MMTKEPKDWTEAAIEAVFGLVVVSIVLTIWIVATGGR